MTNNYHEFGQHTVVGIAGTYRAIEHLKNLIPTGDKTTLLPQMMSAGDIPPDVFTSDTDREHVVHGYIGLNDFTIYPLIRAGSFVRTDAHQNKVRLIAWRNEYERPSISLNYAMVMPVDGASCRQTNFWLFLIIPRLPVSVA